MCREFNVQPGDFIEYVPDALKENETALYLRVDNDPARLDALVSDLSQFAEVSGFAEYDLFADVGCSGLGMDRPKLAALQAAVEKGIVRRIIVCEVTHISRNVMELIKFYQWAKNKGCEVIDATHPENDGLDFTSPAME